MINSNNFITSITSRKSVRKWKNKEIPQKIITQILSAGLSAPSAYNASPWEFIIVTSKKTIVQLLSDRKQMKERPYYINSSKYINKLGVDKYESVSPPPLLIAACGNLQKCEDQISVIQSVSCACENMLLASHSLSLGACWLYVHDPSMPETENSVRSILNIPHHVMVLALIAIGYPNEEQSRKFIYAKEKIHNNIW